MSTKMVNRFVIVAAVLFVVASCSSKHLSDEKKIERVYISDLELGYVIQGWGQVQKDKPVEKQQLLSIGQRKFERGLGTHAPGQVLIDLKGNGRRFHAFVGIDDEVGKQGTCEFKVYGDGKILYQSGILKGGDNAKEIIINIEKIKKLSLQVTDASDGYNYDHANWADAWIEYSGAKPETIRVEDTLYKICGWEGKSKEQIARAVELPFTKDFPGPISDYMVLTFKSPWGREYEIQTQQLDEKGFSFLQTRGRSCNDLKPFIILFNTKTKQGIALMLAWSGNWSIEVKKEANKVRLSARTSPAGLPKVTEVGGLPIPGALISEFTGHWDYGTLPIRRFIRQNLLRDLGEQWPVVQYNDYYGTFGDMNEKLLIDAAKNAAEIGCELFTIDAGWYGNKEQWEEAVGDWTVNTKKFPNGIEPVADAVRKLGMKFGMWIEIENANPKSETAQKHPDWVLVPTGWWTSRVIFNFGKKEVQDFARSVLDRMMSNYKLDYLKIDFNAEPVTNSESYKGTDDPLYGHYKGLIDFWRYLRNNYPGLVIENCSSGSLREDVMPTAFTDTHWSSDNVDNHCNLAINYGATYLLPPEICSHWTTYPDEAANKNMLDVQSRFTVNMMLHLGLSGKIWQWSDETKKIAAERIAFYKKIRPIIRNAEVYHLTDQPIFNHPLSITAVQHVDTKNDKSLVFAFQANDPQLTATLKLRALNSDKTYNVTFPQSLGGKVLQIKGKMLLEKGLEINFPDKGTSGIIMIE